MSNLTRAIDNGNMANAKAQAVEIDRLRAVNADLLAALQLAEQFRHECLRDYPAHLQTVREAIAKAAA